MKFLRATPFLLFSALLVPSLALAQAVAHGWEKITDTTKSCTYNVPKNWTQSTMMPSATASPDKKSHVAVHARTGQSYAEIKQNISRTRRPDLVIQDTPNRYWFSFRDADADADKSDTNWFVVVPGKSAVCIAQINFRNPADESLIRSIVFTIAPTQEK